MTDVVTTRTTRSAAIDVARGVVILGVVLNHTVDGLLAAGALPDDGALAEVNRLLYLFRMPALVLLVGLFVPSGVARSGVGGYVLRRARLLLWLYLVWFVVQTLAELATSGVRNGSGSASDLLRVWVPPAHLWFLPFLAVATAVVAPTVVARRRLPWTVALVVVGVALWGVNANVVGVRGLCLVGFLALGAALGLPRLARLLDARPSALVVAAVLAGGLFLVVATSAPTVPATMSEPAGLATRVVSAVAATLGVVAVLALAALAARVGVLRRPLQHVGGRTLEIYLAHVVVVAGVRIVLTRLDVPVPVTVVACVVAGVAVPLLLATACRRAGVRFLFETPHRP